MSPEQWDRVKDLYEEALECDSAQRADFLQRNTTDEVVRAEVRRLLAGHDNAGSFLSTAPFADYQLIPQQPEKRFAPGEVLAERFRIVSFIAAGGMGEVYEAEDLALKENLALKTIRPEVLQQNNVLERFKQEVHLARRVTHPNICRVFDLFWHKKKEVEGESVIVFVSMELLRGETLSERIRRTGRLSADEAMPLIDQIASGLEAAHRAGVVHRDLKPGNVILVPDREEHQIRCVITDFGLALRTGVDANKSQNCTETQGVFGTPAYMAPEQIEGKDVTKLADIFALGLIIYEMVTGEHAFPANTPLASAAKRLSDQLISPKRVAPGISDVWERTIIRCLQRDPNARYSSAMEVTKALSEQKTGSLNGLQRVLSSQYGRPARIVLALVVLLAIAGAVYQLRGWHGKGTQAPTAHTVSGQRRMLIMPVDNLTGHSNIEYLADGLTEEMIKRVGTLDPQSLGVIGSTTSMRLKESSKTSAEIGRDLGADYVLTSGLRQLGERIRVSVQLVEIASNQRMWTAEYEREDGNLIGLPSEIVLSVSGNLHLRPSTGPTVHQSEGTLDNEAYEDYLRGRFFWNKRLKEDVSIAREYFLKAIARDPNYAKAYAGLADGYITLAGSHMAAEAAFASAQEAAEKAIFLDDTLAEAHTSLAYILYARNWDWTRAEREYKRALELDPQYAVAHHWYFNYLGAMKRFPEAIAETEIALKLDPLSQSINYNAGAIYILAHEDARALKQLQRAIELAPTNPVAYGYLGQLYERQKKYGLAIEEFRKAEQYETETNSYRFEVASSMARNGQLREAQELASELETYAQTHYTNPYWFVTMYAGFGNEERVFFWLDRAINEHTCTALEINADPRLDVYRSDHRFQELTRRMHLPS